MPGQAMDTELGWPGPLHLVTAGSGVDPAGSPQPQPGPKGAGGVPRPWGAAPQGGHGVVGAVVAPRNGAGEHPARLILVSSSSFLSARFPHLDLLLFLSSPPLHAILVSLLLSSSQISLCSSFGLPPAFSCLLLSSAFTSFSSSALLDLPLFSASCHHPLGHFSSPVSSLHPEMAQGHAVCHHHPCFRPGGGVTVPSPAPSQPQHCPQLVLMSPGWDRAMPPAQATVAPTPAALHVLPSQ